MINELRSQLQILIMCIEDGDKEVAISAVRRSVVLLVRLETLTDVMVAVQAETVHA